jgi:hypothetical protein
MPAIDRWVLQYLLFDDDEFHCRWAPASPV